MIKAKKKYGQNFLKDSSILEQIVQSMPKNQKIVEIGPGLGDLTQRLVNYTDVKAYEIDEELYGILKKKFSGVLGEKRLTLQCIDVLTAWEEQGTLEDAQYALVANLPYYIATNIVLRALEDQNCTSITVMVQKEVAEKFCAKCNDREFGAISVIASSLSNAEILFDVPPTAFEPAPKVLSSVMQLHKNPNFEVTDDFKAFLRVCFSAPRKTLIKNLSAEYEKTVLEDCFRFCEIASNARAHQVSTQAFHLLYKKIKEKHVRRDNI